VIVVLPEKWRWLISGFAEIFIVTHHRLLIEIAISSVHAGLLHPENFPILEKIMNQLLLPDDFFRRCEQRASNALLSLPRGALSQELRLAQYLTLSIILRRCLFLMKIIIRVSLHLFQVVIDVVQQILLIEITLRSCLTRYGINFITILLARVFLLRMRDRTWKGWLMLQKGLVGGARAVLSRVGGGLTRLHLLL